MPKSLSFNAHYIGQAERSADGESGTIRIRFGGPMFDFGYLMSMDRAGSTGSNHWQLQWFDDNRTETWMEFDLSTNARLPAGALMPDAFTKYADPASGVATGVRGWTQRIRFGLMTGHPEAGQLIDRAISSYPDEDMPRVAKALYVVAQGQESAAIAGLGEWAQGSSNTNAMEILHVFRQSLEDFKSGSPPARSLQSSGSVEIDSPRLIEAIRAAQKH